MIKGLSLLRNIGTDYTHLYRMVQATYHTSPWWVKGLEFVLQWALTVEILVWFAVFGPVALGWYIPVVLLSLYLNAFTLLHTRYLPSWGEAMECSFSDAGWDRIWNIRTTADGLWVGMLIGIVWLILIHAGVSALMGMLVALIGLGLLFCASFFTTTRLVYWLYCTRHHLTCTCSEIGEENE